MHHYLVTLPCFNHHFMLIVYAKMPKNVPETPLQLFGGGEGISFNIFFFVSVCFHECTHVWNEERTLLSCIERDVRDRSEQTFKRPTLLFKNNPSAKL